MLTRLTTVRRDEITFRQVYLDLLQAHKITTIFRPGQRTNDHPKSYHKGEVVTLRVVERVGADWAHVPGELRSDIGLRVEITDVVCKPLGLMHTNDFEGSSPDVYDQQSLKYHLGALYNLPPSELTSEAMVTRTTFRYLKDMHEGTPMFNRLLHIAQQPPYNGSLDGTGPLVVPLIGEDYPARTALLWNTVYQELGMPDTNVMMVGDPAHTKEILDAFRADPRYVGGGAGVGFKEAVLPYLDEVTDLARAMGSVNIIKKVDSKLIGHNTDGTGYALSLKQTLAERGANLAGERVLLLGAGGTARAIGFALAQEGARLTILNRTGSKAVGLARDINEYFDSNIAAGAGRERIEDFVPLADVIVSTVDDIHSPLDVYSPLGDMPTPITPQAQEHNLTTSQMLLLMVPGRAIISDIRIRKETTPMLKQAHERGLPTLDGIPMVINQAIEAFWWIYGDALASEGATRDQVASIMRSI